MASSRSRDFSEEDLEETTVPLPEMMFAEGEEPVGVRVLTYQSSRALNTILEALESRVLYIPASRLRKYLLRIVALPATTFNPSPAANHCFHNRTILTLTLHIVLKGFKSATELKPAIVMCKLENFEEKTEKAITSLKIDGEVRRGETRCLDGEVCVVKRFPLPMMEISGTHEERWAAWDDEKYDKKMENMLGMIKNGHVFSKSDWGGGDAGDPIYKHREKVNAKKRKGAAHVGVTEAPVLKQRRVSGYFRRGAMVDVEEYRRMEAHVQELVLEVQKLKNVVEKQGTVRRSPEVEDEDDRVEDDIPAISAGDTQGEGDVRTPEQSSRSMSEDRPSLLVRLPPGNGVPLQWVETGARDKVVYRAVHSQTFFVHSEEEDSSVGGGSREQGGSGDGLDASAMSDLDALVLAATGVKAGGTKSEGTPQSVLKIC
uniref:Uncharacterized protein n=1 Tax=Brassica campestris TaxID=3711 RepID=M4FBI6_BRACM